MELRHYQHEAFEAILRELGTQRSTMILMATGVGKSVIAAHVAKHFMQFGRIMILAHRKELVRQLAKTIYDVTGIIPAIEMGDEYSDEDTLESLRAPIVISTFQTQYSGEPPRMERFEAGRAFSLVIDDEAHHGVSKSYKGVLDYYLDGNPNLKLVGMTATGDRSDGTKLGSLFKSIAYEYNIRMAIEDGYLVPVHAHAVPVSGLDLSRVGNSGSDFNQEQLAAEVKFEGTLHGFAHPIIEISANLPKDTLVELKDLESKERTERLSALVKAVANSLVFCVNIDHACRLAEIINRWLPGMAAVIHDKLNDTDRETVISDFKNHKVPILCAITIPTEGFDSWRCQKIFLARPSKSRSLVAQMIGRGTRLSIDIGYDIGFVETAERRRVLIAYSDKSTCDVYDFVGNCGRHKLVTAIDILGDGHDEHTLARAKEMGDGDVLGSIEKATEEIEGEQEADRVLAELEADQSEQEEEARVASFRRRHLVGVTNYDTRAVNVMDASAIEPERHHDVGTCSAKQADALDKLGVNKQVIAELSPAAASRMIGELRKKRCTGPQRNVLKRCLGMSDRDIEGLNFAEAQEYIRGYYAKEGH